jgi:hypothetical protein
MKKLLLLYISLIVAVYSTFPDEINFKGFIQTWASYVQFDDTENSGYGFTLKRARLTPYGSFSKKIEWKLQVGWDQLSASLVDAYIDFLLSTGLKIRVGKFPVPGTISSTLTPSTQLDLIERSQITLNWGVHNGLSKFGSLGIQFYGNLLENKLFYAVMLANPRASSLFTPDSKSSAFSMKNWGGSIWTRIEANPLPGLRIGTFYGKSKEVDTGMKRLSGGIHIFYLTTGLNLKLEYIAGSYGETPIQNKYNGFYTVFGYKLNKIEPIFRYDYYSPHRGDPDQSGVIKNKNFLLGINYFYNKNIKFQANFVLRKESMAPGIKQLRNNLFYVCLQYMY